MDNPAEGGLSSIVNLRKKRARKSFKGTVAGNSLLFYVALCNQAQAFMDYVEKWKGKANARENGGKKGGNWPYVSPVPTRVHAIFILQFSVSCSLELAGYGY